MFFIPFLPLLCCCSVSMSSLISCGDKIPFIKDKLPIIYASLSSSTCSLIILCVIVTMVIMWFGKGLLSSL